MRRLVLLYILAIFPVIVSGQETRFLKYYSIMDGNDQGEVISFLPDSSLMIGTSSFYNDENNELQVGMGIYNLNKDGSINYSVMQLEEENTMGLFFQRVIPDFYGGYLVGPAYFNWAADQSGDYLIIKYNMQGEVEWIRSWGTQSNEGIKGICKLPNGNIAVAGTTNEYDEYFDISVFILDSIGNILHSNIFGWEGREAMLRISAMSDTTLVLGGASRNIDPIHEDNEGFLMRLNSEADSLYTVKYYSEGEHGICSFKPYKSDLQLLSASDIEIPNEGLEFAHFFSRQDMYGNPLWTHYLETPLSKAVFDFEVDVHEDIIFTGTDSNLPEDIDLYTDYDKDYVGMVGKLDSLGNELWYRQYVLADGKFSDDFHALTSDAAGNIYITGFSWQYVNDLPFALDQTVMLKLGPDGCFEPGCTEEVLYLRGDSTYVVGLDTITAIQQQFIHQSYFTISPNPITQGGQAVMRLYNELNSDVELRIYDAQARMLKSYRISTGTRELILDDMQEIDAGIYFASLVRSDGKIVETRKIVIGR